MSDSEQEFVETESGFGTGLRRQLQKRQETEETTETTSGEAPQLSLIHI